MNAGMQIVTTKSCQNLEYPDDWAEYRPVVVAPNEVKMKRTLMDHSASLDPSQAVRMKEVEDEDTSRTSKSETAEGE